MRVLVMNLQGNVSMKVSLANPFEAADSILKREAGNYDVAVLDFHAEATSEKLAMGYYLDGRASVVFGTHTHVATADEQVLPHGTGYITDIGMTGPDISILGVATDCIIKGFTTAMPQRYRVAEGKITSHGALFTLSGDKCIKAERITF
jgi:metallophosphoesterase (TIGR00282 family)